MSASRDPSTIDLRRETWIPGLRADDHRVPCLAAALHRDVQRPCSGCTAPCWLNRRDLPRYDRGTPLLCPRCVGEAFVAMGGR